MASVQASTGIFSGIPITDTVDKLMAIAAKPRDLLTSANTTLQSEQTAVTTLAAQLLAIKYITDNLGKSDLYTSSAVSSSNQSVLSASVTGQPVQGTYVFTALRTAQQQQWLSTGVASTQTALGGGTLTLRFGDTVDRTAQLSTLDGGTDFVRGKLRITDRSGATAEIDLSTAQTLDDVLQAINGNTTIDVTAVAYQDGIRLIDNTGKTVSNLKVQESGGTTAASLGLAGVDVASAVADGQQIFSLSSGIALDALNDGRGVVFDETLPDISYQLRDGTTGTIDLSPIIPNSSQVDRETTLGQVLDRINAAQPDKLRVEIDADGRRLKIVDLTSGGSQFQLTSLYGSHALQDLGLDGAAVGDTITGQRILAGTNTVLLSSLNGGQGLGTLGQLQLTDRSGASATIDLSGAETLDDVINAVNAAGVGIRAAVNQAGTGITLTDTSSGQGHLVVASGDAAQTAEKLGIAVDAAVAAVNSGDLHLQIVSENTLLSTLNGGAGVAQGTLTIQDSAGQRATLNLAQQNITTIGDVTKAIGRLNLGVVAEINDTGDGIRLRDTAGGSGQLTVTEGSSTAAHDLGLLRTASQVDIDGQPTQVIDGSLTQTITLDASETLDDLRQQLNALGMGVSAGIMNDGSSRPYRLSLVSQRSGRAGNLVIDGSIAGLTLNQTVAGQDALMLYGDSSSAATGMLVSSSSNKFTGLIDGLSLTLNQASSIPVTLSVTPSATNFVASVKTFVTNYNTFRDKLADLTKYDSSTDTRAVLTGDPAALRLDSDLSDLLTTQFSGLGSIRTLGQLGISVDQDGKLQLDEDQLNQAYDNDPASVQQFFATADTGVSARFAKLLHQLAGEDNSLLTNRLNALTDKIDRNQTRIDEMNTLLDRQRERMLIQFYNMETAIGKIQGYQSIIDNLAPMPIYTVSTSSSS